jgi:hypothetical protein
MKRLILISFLTFYFYAKCTRSKNTLSLKDAITYALENKSDAKKARLVENSKIPDSGSTFSSST